MQKFRRAARCSLIGVVFSGLTLLLSISRAGPGEGTELTQLEKAGKYKEAIDLLQQKPTYDSFYFYNLGILWAKSNQIGLATAYLEKANRLNPHDPEIIRSLKTARTQLSSKLIVPLTENGLDAASNQVERMADRIPSDEILGILGLVVLVVSLFWIRAYLKTRNITKTFLKPSGWFGALALVIAFAFYGIYKVGSLDPPAITLLKQPLRSGPGMNYPEITTLEPGIKIRVVGATITVNENEVWQKVRYKTEQFGWVPLSGLLPL